MAQHTPNTTLQRVIKNTNTKGTILNKTLFVSAGEYNALLQYIEDTLHLDTFNYIENTYITKKGISRSKITYYITNKHGEIINISHVLFLIYKKYMPDIKLNIRHNYIIGSLHTSSEIYARITNYLYRKHNHTNFHIHNII